VDLSTTRKGVGKGREEMTCLHLSAMQVPVSPNQPLMTQQGQMRVFLVKTDDIRIKHASLYLEKQIIQSLQPGRKPTAKLFRGKLKGKKAVSE